MVCLKDEDEVEVLLEGEVMEPERKVDVDIFELVDVKDVVLSFAKMNKSL